MQRHKVLTAGVMLMALAIGASCGGESTRRQFPEMGSGIVQPQLVSGPNQTLLLLWNERGEEGNDLFLARAEGNTFTEAVRINSVPGSVNSLPIDEMRAAIAMAPDGRIGVAWTDSDFDIQLAISHDGGRTFDGALRLNQDDGYALQEFPAIAFGQNGGIHAVWLDPRAAPEGEEEPADLYYAEIRDGAVMEVNLTANQESSVCGCCLPNLRVEPDGGLLITFRNTTPDGYRDPYTVRGTPDGRFGAPQPVSPPIWEIYACPIAGPVAADDMTLWLDGSEGYRRLLSAFDEERDPDVVLRDGDGWSLRYPPREVSGIPDRTILLVPGNPESYLIEAEGHSWHVLADALPGWATSAAIAGDELLLVGVEEGGFRYESRRFQSTDGL